MFFYTFVISYISFKIILIVFIGQNNCNIHLYNKIDEGSYYLRLILFILSILIIFSGWYLNNLFSGNFGENLWRLVLIGDINYYKSFGFFQQNENNLDFPQPTDSKRILLLELEHNSFKGVEGKVMKFC